MHENDCKNPCAPCEREHRFNRVVATWQTVRNYEVRTRDILVPVCTEGLREDNLENLIGRDRCRSI